MGIDARAVRGLNALLASGTGAAQVQGFIDKFKTMPDALERMNEIMMQGSPKAMADLVAAFEGMTLAMADAGFLEVLTEFVIQLTEIMRKIAEADPETLKWMTTLMTLAAVFGPILMAIGGITQGIAGLVTIIKLGLIPALKWLFGLMLAHPVGLLIAAIVALVAGFVWMITHWEETGRFFTNIGYWMAEIWQKIVDGIVASLDFLTSWLPDWVREKLGFSAASAQASTGGADSNSVAAATAAAMADTRSLEVQRHEERLTVDFKNAPPGTRASTGPGPSSMLKEVNLGFNMDESVVFEFGG
jgi:hypothetical protein